MADGTPPAATSRSHLVTFVALVLVTVVALGSLFLHRSQPGVAASSPPPGGPGTTVAAAPATSGATTTTAVVVPGFATPADYLACVREHESDDEYTAVSPSGSFFGAYQIDQQTWNNTVQHAGLTSLYDVQPNEATPASQDEVAMALLQWQGTAPWAGDC